MRPQLISKKDVILSLIIGSLIGLFSLITIRVIKADLGFEWAKQWEWLIVIILPVLCFLAMTVVSLLKEKILIIYQFAKFVLVGALNTFIDFGILNLLIWATGIAIGLHYSLFKAISFFVAATNSYFWNKHWTFEKKDSIFASGEFVKFLVVTFIGFLINVGTASLVVNVIGPQYGIGETLWANIGAFAAVFVAFIWNFLGSKLIVFKK
jgi:putative flippase GtrA